MAAGTALARRARQARVCDGRACATGGSPPELVCVGWLASCIPARAPAQVEKEYLVRVTGHEGWSEKLRQRAAKMMCGGMELDGKPLREASVRWLNEAQLQIVLTEGKHRQARCCPHSPALPTPPAHTSAMPTHRVAAHTPRRFPHTPALPLARALTLAPPGCRGCAGRRARCATWPGFR